MTQYLPPNLLALFAARDPVPFLPPMDKLVHEKKRLPYFGLTACIKEFEDPKDTPPPTRVETRDERKERKRKERAEQHAYKLEQDLALWDPASTTNSTGDPFKTLFVARVNYDTSESKLRREFEVYGPIKKIHLAHDKFTGKPRGYAFIEYEHERDMHSAYKHADGKKIDGRRVLVDVERGRTVKGWRPRRLGGGLGGTRKGGPEENTRFSGRDEYATRDYRDEHRERSRSRERERERPERPERRRRSRSPRERRRSRSPRERRRSRSPRERRRSKEREDRAPPEEEEEVVRKDRKRSRRSRSRDRNRRSRSREAKRRRRSRSRERKRDRDRKDERGAGDAGVSYGDEGLKQEEDSYGYEGANGNNDNMANEFPDEGGYYDKKEGGQYLEGEEGGENYYEEQ